MIALDHAKAPVSQTVLHEPGGFAWWYAEILDEHGNGAVVVWSYGLPFLPGYKSDNDRGHSVLPVTRPSLNIALYENGKSSFYLLHEFSQTDVEWDGEHYWRFGKSEMRVSDTKGQRSLEMQIDCPVGDGGDRLRGSLTLEGKIPSCGRPVPRGEQSRGHRWTPLALPAQGEFSFQTSDYNLCVLGDAYFDRNASADALHQLGIDYWMWGHAPTREGNRIVYVLWEKGNTEPLTLGYDVDADGKLHERHDLTPVFHEQRRTVYGMETWQEVRLLAGENTWMQMKFTQCVDNGPFYLRYLTETRIDSGRPVLGSAEVINPGRVDLLRHRALVRMRVSRDTGQNSIWLPLFEGARRTRILRMLKSAIRKALRR